MGDGCYIVVGRIRRREFETCCLDGSAEGFGRDDWLLTEFLTEKA